MVIAIFILLVIIIFYDIAVYNSFIFFRQKTVEAWSGIEVQLKRRHDLIPQLVNVVKGYVQYEQDVLEHITRERAAAVHIDEAGGGALALGQAEQILFSSVNKLFALAESYPDLKANKNFLALQEEISETEDHVAAARSIYNQNANIYNTKLQTIPSSLVAQLHKFKKIELFEMK